MSLTGIITKVAIHDTWITPGIETLKADLFDHKPPDKTVILHRREIMRREPPFDVLTNADTNAIWETRVLGLIDKLPYISLTVMIDKHAHKDRYSVWLFNPYHYCMRAMVERYVLWLNRHNYRGDVVIEPRFKKVDKALKHSFSYAFDHGTGDIPARTVQKCLTSRELKFEPKTSNVCGLQLVELIAHPSHCGIRAKYTNDPMPASFGKKIYECLEAKKLARNPKTRIIDGWGQKWLP